MKILKTIILITSFFLVTPFKGSVTSKDSCNDGEIFYDTDRCDGYFTCVNGTQKWVDCETGYVWDEDSAGCNKIEIAVGRCKLGRDQHFCDDDGQILFEPGRCDGFSKCVNGIYHWVECDKGFVWDDAVNGCKKIELVIGRCGLNTSFVSKVPEESGVPMDNTTGSKINSTIPMFFEYGGNENDITLPKGGEERFIQHGDNAMDPGIMSLECRKPGFLGDPSDCSKFYRCVQDNEFGLVRFEIDCVLHEELCPDWIVQRIYDCNSMNILKHGLSDSVDINNGHFGQTLVANMHVIFMIASIFLIL